MCAGYANRSLFILRVMVNWTEAESLAEGEERKRESGCASRERLNHTEEKLKKKMNL